MSIYTRNRQWKDMTDVVQAADRTARRPDGVQSAPRRDSGTDWTGVRKAAPADYLLPNSEKWFDALPVERAPCALATQYPRIVNMIVAQWHDHRGAPELFEELLHDRRGNRAGFPPAVRRDLVSLQEFWYTGALKVR